MELLTLILLLIALWISFVTLIFTIKMYKVQVAIKKGYNPARMNVASSPLSYERSPSRVFNASKMNLTI
jgi:hypothetical protein